MAAYAVPGPCDRRRTRAQGRGDRRQQDLAALVQRGRADRPAAGDDLDRRVDVGQVPPAVAAGVLHAGAEHAAGPELDLPGDLVQLVGVESLGGTVHADAPGSQVTRLIHLGLAGVVPGGPATGKQRRPPCRAVACLVVC